MRIAMVVDGTRGDVQPMLVLGAALAAEGHSVRICAPPDFRSAAVSAGLEFHAVGKDVRAYLTDHAEAIDGNARKALLEGLRYSRDSVRAQFETLPDATAGADLIIGAGVQVAGPSVAQLHRIPYRYVAYCPAILPSEMHPPFLVPAQSMPRWANRLAWRATHRLFASAIRPFVNAQRGAFGLPPIGDIFRYILTQRPVVAADEELAPLPRDCPPGVRQIRALQPPPGEPLPAKLESFLEQGPPPVYLGFGSMTDARPARTTREILRAVAAIGCRALVSRGWAGLGGEALPEGVLEIDAVCHAQLFPRVAAVVHHGGAGTTTMAARAGVPQILVPHLMDQFYWGRRVQLLGLGPPPLARKRLRADRLAAALEATLENELLAERAREVGERLRARSAIDTSTVLAD